MLKRDAPTNPSAITFPLLTIDRMAFVAAGTNRGRTVSFVLRNISSGPPTWMDHNRLSAVLDANAQLIAAPPSPRTLSREAELVLQVPEPATRACTGAGEGNTAATPPDGMLEALALAVDTTTSLGESSEICDSRCESR